MTTELLHEPFIEFAIILLMAALLGAAGQLLRQPLIVMFIGLGILVGPSALDVVHSHEKIHLLAEIGISILLFVVGLKLDLRVIKSVGRVALITGIGQVVFTSLIGYVLGLLLGLSSIKSLYVAVALTFSSTIIIVKLLSDKKEIDSLHGQIAVGFLIVQDIVVILTMIALSALNQNEQGPLETTVRTTFAGLLMVLLTIITARYVFPWLGRILARAPELLTLFGIAWAVSMGGLGELMNLSPEVGSFLAGVALASSAFKDLLASRLASLRDFLLLFFFVSLGVNIDLHLLGAQVPAAIALSLFVLIGNPLIVMVLMGLLGYRSRTSFLAGLTVAQISEFSLILAGMGLAIGHIDENTVGLITLVGLITIGASTYMILYSHQLFEFLTPALNVFQRKTQFGEVDFELHGRKRYDVIILGLGRFGDRVADLLEEHTSIHFLGVDFDPAVIEEWKKRSRPVIYGDIDDSELLDHIPYNGSRAIILTVTDSKRTSHILAAIKRVNYSGKVFVVMRKDQIQEEMEVTDVEVLLPYQMAASRLYESHLKKLLAKERKHKPR
jgi:Kef-type K+ transport system membrane component KefB